MSPFERLNCILSSQKKTVVRTLSTLSIAALLLGNIAPELGYSLPSLADEAVSAQMPNSLLENSRYIVVTQNGNSDPTIVSGCALSVTPASGIPAEPADIPCNLAQAITRANAATGIDPITIIFTSNTTTLPNHRVDLTANLPAISRTSGGRIIIDGAQPNNAKTILIDNSNTNHNGLDHFFLIQSPAGDDSVVTIQNMAFTGLRKSSAAAITTRNLSAGTLGTEIGQIEVKNNYFGTENGTDLLDYRVTKGINLFATNIVEETDFAPEFFIEDNYFYDVVSPIRLGGTADNTVCTRSVPTNQSLIEGNHIGLPVTGDIDVNHGTTHGSWSGAAIDICNLSGILIRANRIANSLGSKGEDIGIQAVDSSVVIDANTIGITAADPIVAEQTIYGYGIHLAGVFTNSGDGSLSIVSGNLIAGISNAAGCADRYDYTPAGKACGGTGIRLESSYGNLIYNNLIGAETTPNEGYGIEVEGTITTSTETGDTIHSPSHTNKIIHNSISYNQADGVHIAAIENTTELSIFDVNECTNDDANITNNCFNLIGQNFIHHNGRFNGDSSTMGEGDDSVTINAPQGGIGIDLRNDEDTIEQKYGATLTASGTTQDSDISVPNDGGDKDTGGNGVLNMPVIFGTGSTSTGSTVYEIHGHLPYNVNGKYWVEVFAVACPDPLSETESLAHEGCDTDSPSEVNQENNITYGQGYNFLCGTYIEKTTAAGSNWSCKPSDFATGVFAGGLVTATVTSLFPEEALIDYADLDFSNYLATLPFGGDVPRGLQYTCALFTQRFSNITSICPSGDETAYLDNDAMEVFSLGLLLDTSEFSQNIFLPPPSVNITKTLRTCTGSNAPSCSGNFLTNVARHPGEYVEFRIDIENSTGETIEADVGDVLPEGLTFESATCFLFNNQQTVPANARPSGGTACQSSITNNTNYGQAPISIDASRHALIYIVARVSPTTTATTLTNTATVVVEEFCPLEACSSSATITVSQAPGATVTKVIVNPSNNGTASTETLSGPTGNTAVDYRITATLRGITRESILSSGLEDNFPRTVGSNNATYSNCTYRMRINDGAFSTPVACNNASLINTATTPIIVWQGSNIPVSVGVNDTVIIEVNYRATVPALPAGATNAVLTNTATWNNPAHGALSARQATATLTITAPAPTGQFDLTKTVNPTTLTASATAQNVTYTITLTKPAGVVVPAFTWNDSFPGPLNNYSNCQVTVTQPAGTTVAGLTCATSLTGPLLVNSTSIPANVTQIRVTYTATLPANTTSSSPIVNNTVFGAEVNEDKIVETASATLTVNAASTSGTATPSITKKVNDNNVTGTNRSQEKVFKPGDTVNYTLTLLNSGQAAATNATVKDTLPVTLGAPAVDSTPTGTTGTVTGQILNVPSVTIPTGTTGVSVNYHTTVDSKSDFDLDEYDMDNNADPDKDDEFFISSDADLDPNITRSNNNHRREKDIVGKPDGKFVSLGKDGSLVIDLSTKLLVDGKGNDFAVLELDRIPDDTDKTDESYTVSVSQDNVTFKKIGSDNEDSNQFDLKKVNLTWIRYIKIEDTSSTVKASSPGSDIDAICLLNQGVQVPNRAELTYNGQTSSATANVVVDITSVFKKKADPSNCEEPEEQITPPPAPPLPSPPAPPAPVVQTPPPALPKTGPGMLLSLLGLLSAGTALFVHKKF